MRTDKYKPILADNGIANEYEITSDDVRWALKKQNATRGWHLETCE